jgi:hypothetical protein
MMEILIIITLLDLITPVDLHLDYASSSIHDYIVSGTYHLIWLT